MLFPLTLVRPQDKWLANISGQFTAFFAIVDAVLASEIRDPEHRAEIAVAFATHDAGVVQRVGLAVAIGNEAGVRAIAHEALVALRQLDDLRFLLTPTRRQVLRMHELLGVDGEGARAAIDNYTPSELRNVARYRARELPSAASRYKMKYEQMQRLVAARARHLNEYRARLHAPSIDRPPGEYGEDRKEVV